MPQKPLRYLSFKQFNESFDLVSFAKQYDPNYRNAYGGIMIHCPYHDDGNPSCIVDNSHAYCFACNQYATPVNFVAHVTKMSPPEVLESTELENYLTDAPQVEVKRTYRRPKENIVKMAHSTLLQNNGNPLDYLYRRGLSLKTIQRFKLGFCNIGSIFKNYNGWRYSIPVYDHAGQLITIRYRASAPEDEPKYLTHPATASVMFNTEVLRTSHNVVYVGSQIDAMLLDQMGIAAVGSASEGTILPEYAYLFSGVNVFIIPDADLTGIKNIGKFIKAFGESAASISVVSLSSYNGEYSPKQDVNSFLLRFGPSAIIEVLNSYGYFGENEKQYYLLREQQSQHRGSPVTMQEA